MKALKSFLHLVVICLAVAVTIMAFGKIAIEFLLPKTEVVTDYLYLQSHGHPVPAPWMALAVLIAGGIAGISILLTLWKTTLRPLAIFTAVALTLAFVVGVVDLVSSFLSVPEAFNVPFFDENLIALSVFYAVYIFSSTRASWSLRIRS